MITHQIYKGDTVSVTYALGNKHLGTGIVEQVMDSTLQLRMAEGYCLYVPNPWASNLDRRINIIDGEKEFTIVDDDVDIYKLRVLE